MTFFHSLLDVVFLGRRSFFVNRRASEFFSALKSSGLDIELVVFVVGYEKKVRVKKALCQASRPIVIFGPMPLFHFG